MVMDFPPLASIGRILNLSRNHFTYKFRASDQAVLNSRNVRILIEQPLPQNTQTNLRSDEESN